MSQYARINSVALLKRLQASLATFSDAGAVALDEVGSDIQRAMAWLNDDRKRYWTNQVRVCRERAVQAKLALKQKNVLDRALSGTTSSAVDERKALAIAERKLREAEAKLARTRSWIMQIDKLQSDYRGGVQGLISAIDADIPNARARLDRMIDSLEAYVALAPPESQPDLEPSVRESVLRPEPEDPAGQPALANLRKIAPILRGRTPSADARLEVELISQAPEWIPEITLPDAWVEAPPYVAAPGPDERVLVALVEKEPEVVFLVRTTPGDGDSGWSIGVEGEMKSRGYAAIHTADLVQAHPELRDILSLPEGYLVVMNLRDTKRTVLDADDNVVWQSPGGDAPASNE